MGDGSSSDRKSPLSSDSGESSLNSVSSGDDKLVPSGLFSSESSDVDDLSADRGLLPLASEFEDSGVVGSSSDLGGLSPLDLHLVESESVLSSSSDGEGLPLSLRLHHVSVESGLSGGGENSELGSKALGSSSPSRLHGVDFLSVRSLDGIAFSGELDVMNSNVMGPLLNDGGGGQSVLSTGSSDSGQPSSVLGSVGFFVGDGHVSDSGSVRKSVFSDAESVGSQSSGSSGLHEFDQSSLSLDVRDSSAGDDSSSDDSSADLRVEGSPDLVADDSSDESLSDSDKSDDVSSVSLSDSHQLDDLSGVLSSPSSELDDLSSDAHSVSLED